MKNKKLVTIILIILFLLLVGLGIYFLLKPKTENIPSQTVSRTEISLGNSELEIDISTDFVIEETKTDILKISEKIHTDLVEQMIESNNIQVDLISQTEGISYMWCDEDMERCIIYDVLKDLISFSFEENPLAMKYDISSINDAKEAWNTAIKDLGFDQFEYFNTNIQRDNGEFTITANRSHMDIPFENVSNTSYTDMLRFNDKGFLLSGKLLIVDYTKEGNNPIVSLDNLKDIINQDIYPKQYIVDRDNISLGLDSDSADIDLGYPEDIFNLDNCNSTSAEIVYIFKTRNTSDYITPAYKIGCSSEISYEGSIYNVPVYVYANAISPEYVVVE